MTHLIATFLYAGHLRPAPGTWGSLAALPAAWAVYTLTGPFGFMAAIAVVFALGWWATARETAGQDDHDPSEIVIDEVAGQWIALAPVMIGAAHVGADVLALWPGVMVSRLVIPGSFLRGRIAAGHASARGMCNRNEVQVMAFPEIPDRTAQKKGSVLLEDNARKPAGEDRQDHGENAIDQRVVLGEFECDLLEADLCHGESLFGLGNKLPPVEQVTFDLVITDRNVCRKRDIGAEHRFRQKLD